MLRFLLMLILLAPLAGPAFAQTPIASTDAQLRAVRDCAGLTRMDFTGIPGAATSVVTAQIVKASGESKEYCRVTGVIEPQVQFELRLPTGSWNGRYFQTGCGGFCGFVDLSHWISNCGDALASDFVVGGNNMGHVGDPLKEPLWGGVPQLRESYGRKSTHAMAVAAKAIVAAYYGARPARSYFRGCSTGGRQGLTEAQYYPDDFDGIIAGDAAFPGRLGLSNNWDANHQLDAQNRPVFSAAKLQLLHNAVMTACDGLDGLKDGILEDPRACTFDPQKIVCPGDDAPTCLTPAQVASAKALYDGARNSKGQRLSPGATPYGSELAWGGPEVLSLASSYLRYLAYPEPRPDLNYRDFNWDTDPLIIAKQAALYDPVPPGGRPDLTAFEKRGGKLIAYHGWADPGVPPAGLLDYYAKVTGAQGGIPKVKTWFRVFMVPGMFHCFGGDAPNTFDLLTAVVAWVEKGTAPDGIIATQRNDDNSVKRTRPLFAYPSVARYNGRGDVNDAANWHSFTPAKLRDDNIDWLFAPKN